jgi:hypothetical protein
MILTIELINHEAFNLLQNMEGLGLINMKTSVLQDDTVHQPAAVTTPISRYFAILSPDTYGDGVEYQRKLRDEWDA